MNTTKIVIGKEIITDGQNEKIDFFRCAGTSVSKITEEINLPQ